MAGAGLNPKSAKQKSLGEVVSDIVELLKAYAKQETLGPLKRLGRYLGFGIGGSVLIATGLRVPDADRAPRASSRDRVDVHRQLVVGAVRDRGRGEPGGRGAVPQLHEDPEGRPEMSAAAPAPQITRADIEAKFRELQGGATKQRRGRGRDRRRRSRSACCWSSSWVRSSWAAARAVARRRSSRSVGSDMAGLKETDPAPRVHEPAAGRHRLSEGLSRPKAALAGVLVRPHGDEVPPVDPPLPRAARP